MRGPRGADPTRPAPAREARPRPGGRRPGQGHRGGGSNPGLPPRGAGRGGTWRLYLQNSLGVGMGEGPSGRRAVSPKASWGAGRGGPGRGQVGEQAGVWGHSLGLRPDGQPSAHFRVVDGQGLALILRISSSGPALPVPLALHPTRPPPPLPIPLLSPRAPLPARPPNGKPSGGGGGGGGGGAAAQIPLCPDWVFWPLAGSLGRSGAPARPPPPHSSGPNPPPEGPPSLPPPFLHQCPWQPPSRPVPQFPHSHRENLVLPAPGTTCLWPPSHSHRCLYQGALLACSNTDRVQGANSVELESQSLSLSLSSPQRGGKGCL